METFTCPGCGDEHHDPAEAVLGHRAICTGCDLEAAFPAPPAAAPLTRPLAA